MTIVITLIAFAALFALAGVLRPRRGCNHDCGACPAACSLDRQEHT
jgi:hypothetical protein